MKTKSIVLLLFMSMFMSVACSEKTPQPQIVENETVQFIDIRIYPDNMIRFNGKMLSESGLNNHIQNLNVSEETRARIIFNENASFGIIMQAQRYLYEKGVMQINAKRLASDKFLEYNENTVHIDILNSDKLLFDGNLMHVNNLEIALQNMELPGNAEFVITVGQSTTFGAVHDIQKLLAMGGFNKISNS